MTVNYIALAIPAFFLLIFVEMAVARQMRIQAYRLNDAITDLGCGIGQQVVGIFGKAVILGVYTAVFVNASLFGFVVAVGDRLFRRGHHVLLVAPREP